MSIQDKINKALTDEGRHAPKVTINGESGDANIPENMNVDLRGCTISSLTTAGNNRVNVEGGSISGSVSLKGTAIIIRNCTISGAITADKGPGGGSKIELDRATVSQPITLNSSELTSRHSTYSGSSVWTLTKGSVLRSLLDTINGQTMLTSSDNSEARIMNPTISGVTTMLALSKGARAEIDNGTIQCTDGGTLDNASVEIRNCTSFQATSLFTMSNGARAILRKMSSVQSTTGFNLSSGSYLEVLDVQTLTVTDTMFTMDNSRLEVSRFTTLATNNQYFDASNGSFIRVANGTTMRPQSAMGVLAKSKILMDKIDTAISEGKLFTASDKSTISVVDVRLFIGKANGCLVLDNSALTITGGQVAGVQNGDYITMSNISSFVAKDCQNLNANNGTFLTGTDQGEVHISGAQLVFGKNGVIHTTGVFTVTLTDDNTVSSQGTTIRMSSNGGSTLNLSNINSLNTNQDSNVYVTGVDVFLTAMPSILNNSSRFNFRGDDGGTQRQRLITSKVIFENGGFDLDQYTVEMWATTFRKYNMRHCDVTMSRCAQLEDQSNDDARFEDSVVRDRMSNWQAGVYALRSVVEFQLSTVHNNFQPVDSVLRLEILNPNGSVGVASSAGGSRGSFVAAAGWDVGPVTTSSTKKDSLFLANVGSPSYSGKGSLLVMESTPPDEGNMDYIMIQDANIRIFDFRNCYEDWTNKINRSSPDNIQDDADMNIYVTAQQTLKLDGEQEVLVESPADITLQAPVINEQS